MNKVFSLLVAVFSIFSTQVVKAQDSNTPAPSSVEDPTYSFKPLSWYPLEELSESEKEKLPEFCSGKYRPVATTARSGNSILVEADESSASKNGDAVFTGNVEFSQFDRKIISDKATWSQTSRSADFSGNVTMITPDLVMSGDNAEVHDSAIAAQKNAKIKNSEYSIPSNHVRGTAASINSLGESLIQLEDATYTFCEPGNNDWDIKASEINLDRENGIGSAWHTRLRIKEVPILYFPYYRFPIDDRRMTGFLDPTFSINGEAQATEISIPFYLNLHPQADATITPKQILDHGLLWQFQLRHLTSIFGEGELNYGFLKNDESYQQDLIDTNTLQPIDNEKEDRWLINYKQSGDINEFWHHRWVYNRISDSDYLNDMSPSLSINRDTHMPTRGEVYFDKDSWHFDITGESYQTVDETIALADRPYQRVPQLNLSYTPVAFTGLKGGINTQATQFYRNNDSLTGEDAINGNRLVVDSHVSYTMEWLFAYVTPKVEYKIRQYQLEDVEQGLIDGGLDENPTIVVPKYSLDAGLFFERELDLFNGSYLQTLEPRIMHLQVPYQDQSDIPNFDSSELTFNANQLFRDYRFNGNDRVGDTNQTTLGITTRFLSDSDGIERFNASIGRIFYHQDRRVQLDDNTTDDSKTSSTVAESTWNPFDEWRLYSMIEWGEASDSTTSNQKNDILQQQISIEYNDSFNHMANIGLRENKSEQVRQLEIGVFWALNDSWALIGSRKKDLWSYDSGEVKPADPVLEVLAGFEYQSCCWRAQLMYQEQSKRITSTDADTDKDYGWLLRIELKGLSSFGSNPDDIMNQSIRGYSTRRYFDFESE
jgi:LPS-assembly protein